MLKISLFMLELYFVILRRYTKRDIFIMILFLHKLKLNTLIYINNDNYLIQKYKAARGI